MKRKNNRLKNNIRVLLPLLLVFTQVLFCQENDRLIVNKATELSFYSPDECLKMTQHLLKKAETAPQFAKVYLIEADAYRVKGEYSKCAKSVFNANQYREKINDSLKAEILFRQIFLARTLRLYNQFDNYAASLTDLSENQDKASLSTLITIKLDIEKAFILFGKNEYTKALDVLNTLEKNYFHEIEAYSYLDKFYLVKAIAYKGLKEYEKSNDYYIKATNDYLKNHSKTNRLVEIALTKGQAELQFYNKDYEKSIENLAIALEKAEKLENIYLLEDINNLLALNYLALNDKENHNLYNKAFLSYNRKVYDMEITSVNECYNLIGEQQAINYASRENSLKLYVYSALGVLFLILLLGNLLYFSNRAQKKRLKEIIGYLEVTNKLLVESTDKVKKMTPKKLSIPTETEQNILASLKKFEGTTKFTNKDMSLATLAAQLDINTKYLSEIINKHYNDNFNTYINKLRINYIIEKLKNEPEYLNYKISYLAEESGFSSHSSFATVFKSITGIAPTVFIDLLGKEIHNKKA
ncbi:helix-turn-helix domain-containing protein [Flavobacterium sp. ST-75]|uniref:Helix-turn-helix domain-containing protein n=1 Tax=Flavobacterium rhizophilum TaxID=3163296 RepID=A0ABW8YAB1_9FLAO